MDVIEFVLLFFVLPTLFYWGRFNVPALPVLWILTSYCLWVLWRKGRLDDAGLAPLGLAERLRSIMAIFLPFAIGVTGLVYRYARQDLFSFARNNPVLWAMVIVGYPILSVYPQAIIFRAFFLTDTAGFFRAPG